MLNVVKSDIYRLLKGKAIYICLIIILIMGFVSALTISPGHIGLSVESSLSENIQNPEFIAELQSTNSIKGLRKLMKSLGEYPLDKEVMGQNINLYYVFIVVTAIVLATDFSNHTIKNTLSSAVSRRKYYFSKLITIFFVSTLLLLFNNFSFYIINYFMNGKVFVSPISDIIKLTLIQFPLIYGIISLLIGICFVFGKTSLFNTISIPFIMVVQLIGLGIINLFKIKADWFFDYEIQFALAKLAGNPSTSYIIKCAGLGILYIIVFNVIGYLVFMKKEIK